MLLASERDTLRSVSLRIGDMLLASERSERDTLRSVSLRIADIYIIYILEKWFPFQGERAHCHKNTVLTLVF